MDNNIETFTTSVLTHAIHFSENKQYTELNPTTNYLSCDAVVVNHSKKTFWLTTQETLNHTNQLIQS